MFGVTRTPGYHHGLLAGDYVYERMATDTRADNAIVKLTRRDFDVVSVPHHGDWASAAKVVNPQRPHKSIAFFSAGTNVGYGHPTDPSLSAHDAEKFDVIDKHWRRDIVALTLAPR